MHYRVQLEGFEVDDVATPRCAAHHIQRALDNGGIHDLTWTIIADDGTIHLVDLGIADDTDEEDDE